MVNNLLIGLAMGLLMHYCPYKLHKNKTDAIIAAATSSLSIDYLTVKGDGMKQLTGWPPMLLSDQEFC